MECLDGLTKEQEDFGVEMIKLLLIDGKEKLPVADAMVILAKTICLQSLNNKQEIIEFLTKEKEKQVKLVHPSRCF